MCDHYGLNNLADDDLLEQLKALVAKNNRLSAVMLAHIGEVDTRKLYLGRGCSSMHRYCKEALNYMLKKNGTGPGASCHEGQLSFRPSPRVRP